MTEHEQLLKDLAAWPAFRQFRKDLRDAEERAKYPPQPAPMTPEELAAAERQRHAAEGSPMWLEGKYVWGNGFHSPGPEIGPTGRTTPPENPNDTDGAKLYHATRYFKLAYAREALRRAEELATKPAQKDSFTFSDQEKREQANRSLAGLRRRLELVEAES